MGRLVAVVGLVALLAGAGGGYAAGHAGWAPKVRPAAAADECFTFAETGKAVCGIFLTYWREHGGLAQQGLPLSDAFMEKSDVNGQTYKVQYFERAVFEEHPENAPPYNVLLSLLGREKYLARYSGPQIGKVGQRIARGGVAVTLNQVLDPAPAGQYSKPGAGNRWVALDVSLENTGSVPSDYNMFNGSLKTADSRKYQPTSGVQEPRISSGKEQPGEIVRGWITFELPSGAAPASFTYDASFGDNPITFDLSK